MKRSEEKAALPAHDFVISLTVLDADFKAPAVGVVGYARAWLTVKGTLLELVFCRGEKKSENITQIHPDGLK